MGGKSSPAPAPAPVDYEAQARAQLMVQQQQQQFQAQQDQQAAQRAAEQRAYEDQIRREEVERNERMRQEEIAAQRAEQQRVIDQQSAKEAQAAAEKQQAAQAAEAERQRVLGVKTNQYNSNIGAASNYGSQSLASLGFQDTYGIGSAYNSALEQWKSQNADINSYNGGSFDSAGTFERIKSEARAREQGKLKQSYSSLTAPDWERGYFKDTDDDAILEAILNEQYNNAFGTVKTAKDRGQLSDGAFTLAQNTLNTKKQAGNATLQSLGGSVLGGYRGQLSDLGRQYADTVSNWDLGNSFTADTAKQGFDNRATGLRGSLSGDIYKAVGDTQLFDTSTILAGAGTAAGANNNPLLAAFANANNDPNKKPVDDRTTGTAGVF